MTDAYTYEECMIPTALELALRIVEANLNVSDAGRYYE